MKKVFIVAAAILFAASTSFGAATGDINFADTHTGKTLVGHATDAASANKTQVGRTSTGVSIAWNTDVNGYALMTQHKSGTKAYGSSYDSTAIYQTVGSATPGEAAFGDGTLAATDTTDFVGSDWNAM